MKAKLLILSYFAIASLHAADPATENSKDSSADNQLRQGLFEEEANQNYEKAGTHYRAVLDVYQRQRTLAATATYRLGELARKANDQIAAVTAFRAVLEQFPEQEKLVQLSRENLTALGFNEPALAERSGSLLELEKAILNQSDVVEEKRKIRDNLLRRAPAMMRDDMIVVNGAAGIQGIQSNLEKKVASVTTELAEMDKMIKQIDSLNGDEVIRYVVNLDAAGGDLKSLYTKYQTQERLLKAMQAQGLGQEHPSVKSQSGSVESLYKQLQASVVSFKELLKSSHTSKLAELKDHKKRVDEFKEVAAENVILISQIQHAQKELETQQNMLDLMREKLTALGNKEPVQGDAAADSSNAEQTAEIARLKQLITKSPDLLNAADMNGWRPIHHAAAKGWIRLIDFLVQSGGDVNMRTIKENATALHIATGRGRLDVVQKLLAAKADSKPVFLASTEAFAALGFPFIDPEEMKTIRLVSALDISILCDYREIARFLTKPSPESAVLVPQPLNDTDRNQGGIWLAVRLGRNALAKELIDVGAPINQKISDLYAGNQEQSLLYYALSYQNLAFAAVLLDAGADPKLGGNPISAAVNAYVEPLKVRQNPFNQSDTVLTQNDIASYKEMIKRLIKAGADVNKVNSDGLPPIHEARNLEMEEFLLAHGADPNLKNRKGETMLDLAVRFEQLDSIRLLLKHGATCDDPMALIRSSAIELQPVLREELLYPKMHREMEGNRKAIHLVVVSSSDVFRNLPSYEPADPFGDPASDDPSAPSGDSPENQKITQPRIVATATSPDSAAPTMTEEWLKEIHGKYKSDAIRIMRFGAEGRFSSVHERKFKEGEAFPIDWPKLQWGDIIEVNVVAK
jgi:ankyrin repeat protein